MLRIKLLKGYAEVPEDSIIIDLSKGNKVDVGVISDREGELPTLVVISSESVRGLSVEAEEDLINKAIRDLPRFRYVKEQELPFPNKHASDKEWIKWNDSFRLGFFPLAMFKSSNNMKYRIFEDD